MWLTPGRPREQSGGGLHPCHHPEASVRPTPVLLAAAFALVVPHTAFAQADDRFARTDAMVAMRDGVKLNTNVYVPKNQTGALPIVLLRTPYGIDFAAGQFRGYLKELADDGYIFAFQDIRGRFKSGGTFVM